MGQEETAHAQPRPSRCTDADRRPQQPSAHLFQLWQNAPVAAQHHNEENEEGQQQAAAQGTRRWRRRGSATMHVRRGRRRRTGSSRGGEEGQRRGAEGGAARQHTAPVAGAAYVCSVQSRRMTACFTSSPDSNGRPKNGSALGVDAQRGAGGAWRRPRWRVGWAALGTRGRASLVRWAHSSAANKGQESPAPATRTTRVHANSQVYVIQLPR